MSEDEKGGQYAPHEGSEDDVPVVDYTVRMEIASTQLYAAMLSNPAVTSLGDIESSDDDPQYRIDAPPPEIAVAMAARIIALVDDKDELARLAQTVSEDVSG